MNQISMIANAFINHNSLGQIEIVDLLATKFFDTLCHWWDIHLTKETRKIIKKVVKYDDDGVPIFDKTIGHAIFNGVNTLFTLLLNIL